MVLWCLRVWALKDIFLYVTFHHIMKFLDMFNSFQYYFICLFFPKQSVIDRHVSLTLNFHDKIALCKRRYVLLRSVLPIIYDTIY